MSTTIMTSRPTEDALIGIDRALSFFERELTKNEDPPADLVKYLRAVQAWLAAVNHDIQLDDAENDRWDPHARVG